jgi:hypothetical protein
VEGNEPAAIETLLRDHADSWISLSRRARRSAAYYDCMTLADIKTLPAPSGPQMTRLCLATT